MRKILGGAIAALTAASVACAESGEPAEQGEAADESESAVMTTESGLQYEMLREGDGASPGATDRVRVHYRGTLTDGTQFDSSYDRGEPAVFPVNGVIAGFGEALQMMSVGSHVRVTIPPELGYGESGAGALIGPNATLVFEIELLEIMEG